MSVKILQGKERTPFDTKKADYGIYSRIKLLTMAPFS
jgi:hypothetical protein